MMSGPLGGWQVSGIMNYVSGAPVPYAGGSSNFNIQGTSSDGYDLSMPQHFSGSFGLDASTMPFLTCDPRENVPDGYLFNPACFGAPTPYMLSDADGRVMQAGDIVIAVEALSFDSTGITPKPDDLSTQTIIAAV